MIFVSDHFVQNIFFFKSGGPLLTVKDWCRFSHLLHSRQPATAYYYSMYSRSLRRINLTGGVTGRPRFRCVSKDEFRQINEFHLRRLSRSWAAFGTEPLLYSAFPPFRVSLYRVRDEYGVGLEYGGEITCRGSCRPPLIQHCMIRRADMKIQPYY